MLVLTLDLYLVSDAPNVFNKQLCFVVTNVFQVHTKHVIQSIEVKLINPDVQY